MDGLSLIFKRIKANLFIEPLLGNTFLRRMLGKWGSLKLMEVTKDGYV